MDSPPPMQFRLSTLLLAFVVLAMSLAVFGAFGIVMAPVMLWVIARLRSRGSLRSALTTLGVVSTLVILAVVGLQDSIDVAWNAARRSNCQCNLSCIYNGLLIYESANGKMPPAWTADNQGRRLHSWRVLALPYLEMDALYNSFQLNEPWDAPINTGSNTPVGFYRCPADESEPHEAVTNYVAIVGPDSPWGKTLPTVSRSNPDSSPNPALLVELVNSRIQWAEPRDLTLDEACRGINTGIGPGISSAHACGNYLFRREPLGANILFADGSCVLIPTATPPDLLRRVLSGERDAVGELDQYRARVRWQIQWMNCAALAGLVASLFAMLLEPRRELRKPRNVE